MMCHDAIWELGGPSCAALYQSIQHSNWWVHLVIGIVALSSYVVARQRLARMQAAAVRARSAAGSSTDER